MLFNINQELSWKEFINMDSIRGLSLNEQTIIYNSYLNQLSLQRNLYYNWLINQTGGPNTSGSIIPSNLQIGDQFGGGTVFYVSKDLILIMGNEDILTPMRIGSVLTENTGSQLGIGYDNTFDGVEAYPGEVNSLKVPYYYTGSNHSDWYLPSLLEMQTAVSNISGSLTSNGQAFYATSTSEKRGFNTYYEYAAVFYNNPSNVVYGSGSYTRYIRPVRQILSGSYQPSKQTPLVGESYQGGIVFYHSDSMILIMSPEDISLSTRVGTVLSSVTGSVLGGGFDNTQAIITAYPSETQCADIAVSYNGGGYNDWYLPSLLEMQTAISNLEQLYSPGTFTNIYYATSTSEKRGFNTYYEYACVYGLSAGAIYRRDAQTAAVRAVRRILL